MKPAISADRMPVMNTRPKRKNIRQSTVDDQPVIRELVALDERSGLKAMDGNGPLRE